MHARAQKLIHRFLLYFHLFCFILIICLSPVESIFHMFSLKVSRIKCFIYLIFLVNDWGLYALMIDINMH